MVPQNRPSDSHDPLRILLWSPRGSGTHYYGPGSFHYRLYSSAAPGRFNVTLAHGLEQQSRYELFADQHFLAPISEHTDSALKRWRITRRFLREADAFLEQHRGAFDIFHGLTGFLTTMKPAVTAERLGLPAVIFIANHKIDLADTARVQRMIGLAKYRRKMANKTSAVIAMSSAIERELLDGGIDESRIARIPMAVDINRFRPARDDAERRTLRASLGWPDRPTLLFTGRVGRRKRPNLLIEAVAAAAKLRLDSQAVIAGPSADELFMREMKDRAAVLGVTDRIVWAGFHEDPAPLYRAADAFALPSALEGMPASLVEASASGLPGITTRISGCEDVIIDGETGRFVKPTAAAVAGVWIEYLRDESLRRNHGLAGRNRAIEHYSTGRVLDQYEALFRRIRR